MGKAQKWLSAESIIVAGKACSRGVFDWINKNCPNETALSFTDKRIENNQYVLIALNGYGGGGGYGDDFLRRYGCGDGYGDGCGDGYGGGGYGGGDGEGDGGR